MSRGRLLGILAGAAVVAGIAAGAARVRLAVSAARSHCERAALLLERGDALAARASAEQAVALDAGSAAAWLVLGRARIAVRDAGATAALRRAVALDPSLPEAWYALGSSWEGRREPSTENLEALARACRLAPGDPRFRRRWAEGLVAAGRFEEAEPVLEAAGDPTDLNQALLRIHVGVSLPATPERRTRLRRWVDSAPEDWRSGRGFAAAAGAVLERTGDARGARTWLLRAVVQVPDDRESLFRLARISRRLGDATAARAWEAKFAAADRERRDAVIAGRRGGTP
ncbi:MAG: hypothetical protein ACKO5K_07705 [Armatimonadota bacterium]